jgi:leucyl aminopeptidase (aminopeptidase T)
MTQTLNKSDINLGLQILKTNLGLKSTESLLVVTDPQMAKLEAQMWFQAGEKITPKTTLAITNNLTAPGQEPLPEIAAKMAQSDVLILQTTYSLTHTAARRKACAQGARAASLPGADLDMIRRTLSIDYRPIQKLCRRLVQALASKNQVRITNPAGTDITLSIKGKEADPDDGFILKPGAYGNLPAGESMLAPVEGSANGVYVVEGAFAPFPTDQPIIATVQNGFAVNITGGQASAYINQAVDKIGKLARNIAELGIGANPAADPQGKILEAEKAYGTVHLALGNNKSYGGTVDVPLHLDGLILSPTLTIDNQVIINQGSFIP